MVRVLDVDAELLEREDRLAADVRARVERGQVEVAALVEDLGHAVLGARVLEVEVLELGADVVGVEAHVGRALERPAHDPARIALVGLAAGDLDVAEHPPGRVLLRHARAGRRTSQGRASAIMSDSSIGLKPVIDEPSKPMPPSNASSSSVWLIEKLLSWPRTSVNHSRMKRTSLSLTILRTSAAVSGSVWHLLLCRSPGGAESTGVHAAPVGEPSGRTRPVTSCNGLDSAITYV